MFLEWNNSLDMETFFNSANLTWPSFLFLFPFVFLCFVFTSWTLKVTLCTTYFMLRNVHMQGPSKHGTQSGYSALRIILFASADESRFYQLKSTLVVVH
jgi:hypothetical protein